MALNNLLMYHKNQSNQIMYFIYIYKGNLALDKLIWLIYHKTQLNQIIYIYIYIYMMLYCHLHTCRMNHNDIMIKDERRLLYKNMYLSLYCKGS